MSLLGLILDFFFFILLVQLVVAGIMFVPAVIEEAIKKWIG